MPSKRQSRLSRSQARRPAHPGLPFLCRPSPRRPERPDLNAQSIVLRLSTAKSPSSLPATPRFFGGEHARGRGERQAQILKVGHHGSRTSSSPAFLAAVKPEVASTAVVGEQLRASARGDSSALKAVGAKIYGTDVNGTSSSPPTAIPTRRRRLRRATAAPPVPRPAPSKQLLPPRVRPPSSMVSSPAPLVEERQPLSPSRLRRAQCTIT